MLAQIMLLNSETSDRSVDPDADALRLTTIHQAKGLEFAVVFVIGLGEGMFPLRRAIESGDIEEERRLFYVAVTRARDELYLCFPMVNTKGGPAMLMQPSRFITELSPDHYQLAEAEAQLRLVGRKRSRRASEPVHLVVGGLRTCFRGLARLCPSHREVPASKLGHGPR